MSKGTTNETRICIVRVEDGLYFRGRVDGNNSLLFTEDREDKALSYRDTQEALYSWAINWAMVSRVRGDYEHREYFRVPPAVKLVKCVQHTREFLYDI